MTTSSLSLPSQTAPMSWPTLKRLGPLAAVIVLHVGLFHALQSGLVQPPAPIAAREVLVHFITPTPAPVPTPKVEAPTPPKPPKTVPVVRKQPPPQPKPRPVQQPVNPEPSEQAITTPPQPAAPAEPEPFVAAAPVPPPAPAAPASPPPPKTITSGVEYLQPPRPEYPLLSRRKSEEGKVVLRVLINQKGRAEQVEVTSSSGFARLDEAARQAVLRAVFKPQIEDGKPVMVYTNVPITFQLDR